MECRGTLLTDLAAVSTHTETSGAYSTHDWDRSIYSTGQPADTSTDRLSCSKACPSKRSRLRQRSLESMIPGLEEQRRV